MFCYSEVFQIVLAFSLRITISGYYALVCYTPYCFSHSVSNSVKRQFGFFLSECISHSLCSLSLSGMFLLALIDYLILIMIQLRSWWSFKHLPNFKLFSKVLF